MGPMANGTHFDLRAERIALDALPKATGLAASGGDARSRTLGGGVMLNGQVERRRAKKVRAGDLVVAGDRCVRVRVA